MLSESEELREFERLTVTEAVLDGLLLRVLERCCPAAMLSEVSTSNVFASAHAHSVLIMYDHCKDDELFSLLSHSVTLDKPQGTTLDMCYFLTHCAETHTSHSPSSAPEHPTAEEDSVIPLYKRDLWQHL